MPPAIQVQNLSKKFARSLRHAMVYGLVDIARAALIPRRHQSPHFLERINEARKVPQPVFSAPNDPLDTSGLRATEFWALRNLSFDVQQGESLGLIGANGAGKSTLFSVLSGIYGPTEGQAVIRGTLQALISLGAGFHPALSGRENVYINAAILGMTGRRVDVIMESIQEFSGIGEFLDAPVKTYSSGMLVRLAFSVAVHLDPDILLIDEVLAVGDAEFQLKCARFSKNLIDSGKTLVIVSHNMLIMQMMSRNCLWMDHGRLIQMGPTHQVVEAYKMFMQLKSKVEPRREASKGEGFQAFISSLTWLDGRGVATERLVAGEPYTLRFEINCLAELRNVRAWVSIAAVQMEQCLLGASMHEDGLSLCLNRGQNHLDLHLPSLPLQPGVWFRTTAGLRDWSGAVRISDSFASTEFQLKRGKSPCLNRDAPASIRPKILNALSFVPYEWRTPVKSTLFCDDNLGH